MSEYKEFWIEPKLKLGLIEAYEHKGQKEYGCTHVIEYAALEQALQEIAELKDKLRIAVDALESIAANGAVPEECHGYFEGYQHYELVDTISNDTEAAREALKEIER